MSREAAGPDIHQFETETGFIYCEVWPSIRPAAPSLTLLHNFMSTGQAAWGSMVTALRQCYRVILPDMPGHGRSQGYPSDFDYRVLTQQLAALLVSLGAEAGHLAGVSAGGMMAQIMVQRRLVQPRTLTLVSTSYSTNPVTTGNRKSLDPEDFRAGSRWLEATARLHDPHHGDGYFARVLLAGFRRLRSAHTIDLPLSALADWSFPVCLIHGTEDEFFSPAIPKAMAAALPDAELHLIPGQSHVLIFRRAWQVQSLLLGFLQQRG